MIVNGKLKRDETSVNIKDVRYPLPPGIWRKGQNFMNSKNIFLRFATLSDRKNVLTEKITEISKKRLSSETGVLKGILTTSRKRSHKESKTCSPTPSTKSESRGVLSTNGNAAKNPWGMLSESWGVTDFVEDDYLPKAPPPELPPVRQRLGHRRRKRYSDEYDPNVIVLSDEDENVYEDGEYYNEYANEYDDNNYGYGNYGQKMNEMYIDNDNSVEFYDEAESSISSGDEETWSKRSKIPRMRMHADDEEEKLIKRKGKIRNLVSEKL